MYLADLHCDTADELFARRESLYSNDLQISLDKVREAGIDRFIQLAAVFTDTRVGDEEGWNRFFRIRQNLICECDKYGVALVRTGDELVRSAQNGSGHTDTFVLTVEDARILCGDLSRVDLLYDYGVRVITPLWGGKTCIGGAHDTSEGLTDFGRAAVSRMCRIGIVPDISHSSFRAADEIMDICEEYGVAPIATHMNSWSVCGHSRNLTDDRYLRLTKLGGIVGLSLCPKHLGGDGGVEAVLRHYLHYRELCPGKIALGCDFDGTSTVPELADIRDIVKITQAMKDAGIPNSEIEAFCYGTAYEFLAKL